MFLGSHVFDARCSVWLILRLPQSEHFPKNLIACMGLLLSPIDFLNKPQRLTLPVLEEFWTHWDKRCGHIFTAYERHQHHDVGGGGHDAGGGGHDAGGGGNDHGGGKFGEGDGGFGDGGRGRGDGGGGRSGGGGVLGEGGTPILRENFSSKVCSLSVNTCLGFRSPFLLSSVLVVVTR